MSLHGTTVSLLRKHVNQLGIQAGDSLCVHSHLLSFGMLEGGVEMVANVLLETLGPMGTLIVPTYTLNETNTPFNAVTTPGRNVGALSEYIRNLPNAIRSASPMHSHAAIGAQAECLLNSDPATSFGLQSDFAQFHALDMKLILLGCDFQQGGTYLHQMEAICGVPYRQWITVSRAIVGSRKPMQCRYFGRDPKHPVRNDFFKFQELAIASGLVKVAATPYGKSYAISLNDLHILAQEILTKDSYALVSRG